MHFVYFITTEHPLEDPLLKILINVLLNATKKRPHYETFVRNDLIFCAFSFFYVFKRFLFFSFPRNI